VIYIRAMTLWDGVGAEGRWNDGVKETEGRKKNDHFRSLRYFNVPTGVSCGSDGGSEGGGTLFY